MVLIGRFSPQNCPVKRIDPKMSGVKRHFLIGQFLHENGSIKTEILVFLDLFSQFFNMLLWPDPVTLRDSHKEFTIPAKLLHMTFNLILNVVCQRGARRSHYKSFAK